MSQSLRIIDQAMRLTGLSLAELAARLGLREATLYKARGGHIPLSVPARKALQLLLVPYAAAPAAGALRSAAVKAADAELVAAQERLAFLRRHATRDEWQILAGTIAAFHRQAAKRKT